MALGQLVAVRPERDEDGLTEPPRDLSGKGRALREQVIVVDPIAARRRPAPLAGRGMVDGLPAAGTLPSIGHFFSVAAGLGAGPSACFD